MGGARSGTSTSEEQKSEKEIMVRCKVQDERVGWIGSFFKMGNAKAVENLEEKARRVRFIEV